MEKGFIRAGRKQLILAEAFHSRKHEGQKINVFCAIGGNRSGKSYCAGRLCFGKHLRDFAVPNSIYWCISPKSDKSVEIQQKEIWDALPRHMFRDQAYDPKNGFGRERPTLVLDNPRGGSIVVRFKTAAEYEKDPNSFESEPIAGAWIDEPVPERLYNRLTARLLDNDGFMLVSAIPEAGWMSERFEEMTPEDGVLYMKFDMRDNVHILGPEVIERFIKETTQDEIEMRIFGNFRYVGNLIYKEFIKQYKPKGHLIRPFRIPPSWPKFRALDPGRNHPTVCSWFALAPNENAYVYREYVSRHKTVQEDTKKILEASGDEKYARACIIDCSSYAITKANPISVAQQYINAGLPCVPSIRTNLYGEWAGIQIVKKRLEDMRFFVFDYCREHIREFRTWKYKTGREGEALTSDSLEDKNNDALDNVRNFLVANPTFQAQKVRVSTEGVLA